MTIEKTPMEKLKTRRDEVCCFGLAYFCTALRYYAKTYSLKLVQHPAFDYISLAVLLADSITLAAVDPTLDERPRWYIIGDYFFQGFYTIELMMKVLATGFVLNRGAYMRDPWNVFNFTIIVADYLDWTVPDGSFDFEILRSFRSIRPLKIVSEIEGLRLLMTTLVSSFVPLLSALLILAFFSLVFATIGLQLWHGVLKKRCFHPESGEFTDRACGAYPCPSGTECVESYGNPNYGITSFDDIFSALLCVFQTITQNGWTSIQLDVVRAYGTAYVVYFVLLVLIGSLFLVNFTLAVIKSQVIRLYLKEVGREKALELGKSKENPFEIFLSQERGDYMMKMTNLLEQQNKFKEQSFRYANVRDYEDIMGFSEFRDSDSDVNLPVEISCDVIEEEDESLLSLDGTFRGNEADIQIKNRCLKISDFPSGLANTGIKNHVKKHTISPNNYFPHLKSPNKLNEEAKSSKKLQRARAQEDVVAVMDAGDLEGRDLEDEWEDVPAPLRRLAESGAAAGGEPCCVVPFATVGRPRRHQHSSTVFLCENHSKHKRLATANNSFEVHCRSDIDDSQMPIIHKPEVRDRPSENHLPNESEGHQTTSGNKFIFRDQVIEIPSASDVLNSAKYTKATTTENIETSVRPPYKIKLTYIPTALPEEEEEGLKKPGSKKDEQQSIIDQQDESPNKKSARSRAKDLNCGDQSARNTDLASKSNTNRTELAPNKDSGNFSSVVEEIKKDVCEEAVGVKRRFGWSGQEVLLRSDPYSAVYRTACASGVKVWRHGYKGAISRFRYFLREAVQSAILENIMNGLLVVNTVLIAMDRHKQPRTEEKILSTINNVIAGLVVGELVLKLSGLGLVRYFSNSMHLLDFVVAICSLIELFFINGQGEFSPFQGLKAFRVLGIARILRRLNSIKSILEVIGRTIGSFVYVGLLLLVFIFIYALFGMQLYGGRFTFSGETQRQNFDSFHNAFFSLFQVLTLKNWTDVLYPAMRARAGALGAVYIISWIYIGNYVLLNLFLAIMLNEFSAVDEEIAEEGEEEVS